MEDEIENLKKEYPEFFENSAGVLEFALSGGTSSQIADICIRNGINDERIGEIAYRITLVLLGKLPKEKLAFALKEGVGIAPEVAQKISSETNHLIFSQIPGAQPPTEPEKPAPAPSPKKEEPVEELEEPPKPPKKDVYHESIE